MANSGADTNRSDDSQVTREQWYWTALSSMASYIDAGSIVAIGTGLAIWSNQFGISPTFLGILAAIGPNAFGAAVGAIIGGRLGDLLGRKFIYQYDLLLYAFGTLWMVFAVNTPMLLIGTVIVGIAVGADVPTSLALVGELAPSKARGKLMGLTQVAWSLGPIITLVLALVLAPYGLLGIRIVFAHLFVAAMVTWYLRQGLTESARWTAASGAGPSVEPTSDPSAQPGEVPIPRNPLDASRIRALFSGPNRDALLFTGIVYLTWGVAAGTFGIFLPFILSTIGAQSQAASVGIAALSFTLTMLAAIFIFMPFNDRSHGARRLIWAIGSIMQISAFILPLILPFTIPVAIAIVVLFGSGGALAGEPFYKTWSQELFPTMLRTTAQGLTFGVARMALGAWSFFVPILATTGIKPIALVLMIFLTISGVVGFFFMPNTASKSLEEIEEERAKRHEAAIEAASR